VDVLEHLAVARIGLGQTFHVIDELATVHESPRKSRETCWSAGCRAGIFP